MASITDGFKDIFLAGVGAMAIGAEKSKELVDQLIAKGEITVEQGKQLNAELKHQASTATSALRDDAISARLSVMSAEEREAFAARVAELAREANEKEAAAGAVEASEPVDVTDAAAAAAAARAAEATAAEADSEAKDAAAE
ncbi:MAG: hypothetical protein Q4C41_01855 [Eggerthellaceae bacterium]|nr:hypothetical protein [Eggerthellaceae bacterium]